MMDSGNGQGTAPPTRASVILLIFGCVFVEAGARGLHSGLQAAVRIAAVVAALALFAALNRVRRMPATNWQTLLDDDELADVTG